MSVTKRVAEIKPQNMCYLRLAQFTFAGNTPHKSVDKLIYMHIIIKYPQPITTNPNFRVLKKWEQLTGVDAAVYNANGVDQFGFYKPYITDTAGNWCGDWSVNNNWSYLTHEDMLKLAALQNADEFSVAQKMGYLTAWGDSTGGALRVPDGVTWDSAPLVKMIGTFYAGQTVEILERQEIFCEWEGIREFVPMVRVRTFSRADWDKTHATDPQLIHIMTGVNKFNEYRERVKGIVYLPVALGTDFTFRGNFKPAHWWLMERWLN